MRYSPPLDGIRAIAILGVLVYHIKPAALRGGFSGVDVFYVLSGFLITSIILHDLDLGSFSMRAFYLRRIQRLIPNLLVTILFTLFLWMIFMPPVSVRQVAMHGTWAIFDVSNFYVWRFLGGYWTSNAESAPLTHTWSLGVEEQFYLFYPAALVLLSKLGARKARLWLMLGGALSLGLCMYITGRHQPAAFYLLPTRLWELLLGAVLVSGFSTPKECSFASPFAGSYLATRRVLGWVGLALIVLGFVSISGTSGFPGYIALIPAVGTALVIWCTFGMQTGLAAFLSTRPLVRLGKVSYSVYLWHWPLITLGRSLAVIYGKREIFGSLLGGVAGLVLGWLAYLLVEQPLRKRGPGRRRRLAVIGVLFFGVASCTFLTAVLPTAADPGHLFDQPAYYGDEYCAGRVESASSINKSLRYSDVYLPAMPADRPNDFWRAGGVVKSYGRTSPKVVLIGSSHALMYSKTIDEICSELGISVSFLAVNGAPLLPQADFPAMVFNFANSGGASQFYSARLSWIREWHPDVIIAVDRWDDYLDQDGHLDPNFENQFHAFVSEFASLTHHLFIVAQVPVIDSGNDNMYNLREVVTWKKRRSNGMPELAADSRDAARRSLLGVMERDIRSFPNTQILRPDLLFYQADGSVRYSSGRLFFYADGNHLSQSGSDEARGIFRKAIADSVPVSSRLTPAVAPR
jgi:peptidoglycan/LPS O-acetylase OafA/YrhL